MIAPRLVLCLGLSQLVCWGTTFYLVAIFGDAMAAGLGLGLSWIHGGFTVALVAMGLVSGWVGRTIDRRGGRGVMVAGSLLGAAGCLMLAGCGGVAGYYAAWVVLGVAMRCCLYDAAFASLARVGGAAARRPISHITLLGGLASSAFWPIGQALIERVGWRWALVAYAGFLLATVPLHMKIPGGDRTPAPATAAAGAEPPRAAGRRAAVLYAVIVASTGALASALSAHMIGIFAGMGLGMGVAVALSSLRGVGQSAARLAEVLFGKRLSPTGLAVLATALLPLSAGFGFASGVSVAAGAAFSVLFGAGNGLATIVRGTLPLALFDPRTYGATVGRLIAPGFYVSAAAPLVFALVMERFGAAAALPLSAVLGGLALGAAALLPRNTGRA
ncbi:hypothetical protein M2352_004804 [Azospirillum fermentarium]|uniref:MFS transporter n=1 Tax=Azospirillum fermentarium TaxID=1233114 RepID=UPI002225FD87|nr:MFS transporter [Azospirillum fermentarium]MCW2249144.1 hypothetical protein [Azospirillum fermentarium]